LALLNAWEMDSAMTSINKNEYLIDLSESSATSFGKVDFETQTRVQKIFSTVWSAESEISNGGFAQYFRNSAETVSTLVGAFTEIGAQKMAAICGKATAFVFPTAVPLEVQEVSKLVDLIDDETQAELGELDEEFFQCPENLTDLLYDFVMAHPEEFSTR
jgi:hypothetical protein